MPDELARSRAGREAAERALIRIVHHYGSRPEFVLLGGLVPQLLCGNSNVRHAGTIDVDVQVNLEIACGAVNMARLEEALRNAEFEPDFQRVWRWTAAGAIPRTVVKFELLADLDDQPAHAIVEFDGCTDLGAVNLRGTGFASRDVEVRELCANVGGVVQRAEMYVTGLAGFLMAKCAAAKSRRARKDWYDIAFVLIHNDAGGPSAAAQVVKDVFGASVAGLRSGLDDLHANFASTDAQGPTAYAEQVAIDQPDLDPAMLAADAVLAVDEFRRNVL